MTGSSRRGGWSAIGSGLVRSYRQGRQAFARAQYQPSSEDLHAWRKRVKDLWYHERLLAPVCGPAVRGQAKDAHRSADLLGDDHDLGMLREALTGGRVEAAVDLDAVVALIDHRRAELQSEAAHVGTRVYAEKPKAFGRRMRCSGRPGEPRPACRLNSIPSSWRTQHAQRMLLDAAAKRSRYESPPPFADRVHEELTSGAHAGHRAPRRQRDDVAAGHDDGRWGLSLAGRPSLLRASGEDRSRGCDVVGDG